MVTAIFEDGTYNLWVGTLDNGLNKLLPDRSRVVRYAKSALTSRGLSSSRITGVVQDHRGTLWIATRDGGVNLLDESPERIRRVIHNAYDPTSLSVNAAISLYCDGHNGIWVGTDGGGVNHYDSHRFKFGYVPSEPGNSQSLAHPLVRAICEDRTGMVWVGMMEGNLDALDLDAGRVVHYRDQLTRHGLRNSCQVLALLEDSAGNLWVGTDGGGLFLFDTERNIIRHFVHDPSNPQSIPDDYVVTLYEAKDGALWIGGTSGMGLGILDRHTYVCRTLARRGPGANQMSGNYVWAIREDRVGNFWLGTWGAGISVLDPRTSISRILQHDPRDPSSLNDNTILAFHASPSGDMWVGTLGGGLDEFNSATGKILHHTEADGLPNNIVSGILEDGTGRLWLSTNKGISCFDPAGGTYRNYDVSDGVQSAEFNQGAYYKGRTGRMYFGGINGLNVFVPENIVVDSSAPPVRITCFKVLDQMMDRPRDAGAQHTMVLSHDQSSFSFEFAFLDFVTPEKSRYRYMLEGFDKEWIQAGTRRYASYTNLGGGSYIFRVQAKTSDGVWNTRGDSVALRVLPPYWETMWFKAVAVCTLCAIGFSLAHIRMSRLQRKHAIQAEFSRKLNAYQETERRRIAGELHDSLGQDLLIIKNNLARLAARSRRGSRLASEVGEINDSVQHTIEEVSKISFDLHPHMLDRLGLKKTLDATIRKYATSTGLNIRGNIDDVDACYDPVEQINIFRIIQEAINNVVKHSKATRCHVTLHRVSRQCQITVEDNGRGFDGNQLMISPSDRGGYGLGNMEERVRFLHGSMQIRTAPGKGTTIIFLIPVTVQSMHNTSCPSE
jgi:signal transduction histidine kinase